MDESGCAAAAWAKKLVLRIPFLQLARVDGLSSKEALIKGDNPPENGRGGKRRVAVTVDFGNERMTIEVIVAAEGDENEIGKLAIARARDFARKFALDAV